MKNREKLLLGGLLIALVLWQGTGLVTEVLLSPITSRERRLNDLKAAVAKKDFRKREIDLAQLKLKTWGARSLPPEPSVAATLYQHWLIELATKHKLANVRVTPSRIETKPKGDIYVAIPVTVKAQATMGPLCDFLHEFHQAGLLHRITRMSLESTRREGNPPLEITLQVEGLALTNSVPRQTLFAPPAKGDTAPPPMAPVKERSAYAAIASNNLFVRGYNGPPAPRTPPRTDAPAAKPDSFDVAEHVLFVGSVGVDEKDDIWLYDRTSNENHFLSEGASFKIAGIEGTVVTIKRDHVVLRIKDESWRLELGKSLKQMEKIAAPAVTAAATGGPAATKPEVPPAADAKPADAATPESKSEE